MYYLRQMANDLLYKLIHSLTSNEKKSITEQAEDKNATYLQLMWAIEKQEKYNEPALKKLFPASAKNFHKLKSYLEEQILKCLFRQYQTREYWELYEQIGWMDVLVKKRQFELAELYGNTLLKRTSEMEFFVLQFMINSLFHSKSFTDQNYPQGIEHIQQSLEILPVLQNLMQYDVLRSRYYMHKAGSKQFLSTEDQKKQLDEFYSDYLLSNPNHAKSNRARYIFYELWYEYYSRYPDGLKKAAEMAEQCVKYIGPFKEDKPVLYMSFLRNLSLFYSSMDKYSKAVHYIKMLEAVNPNQRIDSEYKFHYLFYVKLYYAFQQKKFRDGYQILQAYQKDISAFPLRESDLHYNICYGLIVSFLMSANDFNKALDYLNELVNSKFIETKLPAFYNEYRLYQIICHFELGNFEILESLIRKAEYSLSKKDMFYTIEKSLILFFKNIMRNRNKQQDAVKQLLKSFSTIHKKSIEYSTVQKLQDIGWIEHLKKQNKL